MKTRNLAAALAVAAAAGAVAGGVAWATIPGTGGVISGCYTKIGGVVRVIDTAKGEKCVSAFEVPFSWNQAGPQGEPGQPGQPGGPGPKGDKGDKGDPGVEVLVAEVLSGGTLIPGGDAVSVGHFSTGGYHVTFGRSLQGCSATASAGALGGRSGSLHTAAAALQLDPNDSTVVLINFVSAFTSQNVDTDFTLSVLC